VHADDVRVPHFGGEVGFPGETAAVLIVFGVGRAEPPGHRAAEDTSITRSRSASRIATLVGWEMA
jgi:hypothetical protein